METTANLNTSQSGRVSCRVHWGGCDPDPRPLLPVPMPKPKPCRAEAAYSDALSGAYRCYSHDASLTRFRSMRREGGSTNVPYSVDLSECSCNCAAAARLRCENARDGGKRYCRHVQICWDWRLMPDLLTVALLPELPANVVPCSAETPAEEKRYTVRVHQQGGSYVSLRGATLHEAERRADGINDSELLVFASIVEEGEE